MKKNKTQLFKTAALLMGVFAILSFTSCGEDPIVEDPIASFQFEVNVDNYLEVAFTNYSQNADSYSWDFGDGSLLVYEENPEHTYTYEDSFVVTQTVEYAVGCTYSYSRILLVTKGYELINPTGFTPNGDGINDTMRPSFKGMKTLEMRIYDTWGSLIYFEEGLVLKGWDGMLKGTYAENGNYVMVVRGTTFYNKQLTETTPITLVR